MRATIHSPKDDDRDELRREANAAGRAATTKAKGDDRDRRRRPTLAMTLEELRRRRLKEAVRRDALFLAAGAAAYLVVGYVETHASDDEIRFGEIVHRRTGSSFSAAPRGDWTDDVICASDQGSCSQRSHRHSSVRSEGIIDAGFILTTPIHAYLARRRDVNDLLAMWNSVFLTMPLAYVIYVTLWKGDFRLSFRLIATHLFRSLCGWFTYLPPDPEFLSSLYDFPEIFLCLFQECSSDRDAQVSFLTFFSGHVATIVIVANHLYMARHTRLSVCLHCFNWLQALRLLATRGHYSIDLIVGYVVAVFVSGPAERFGTCYSRGVRPALPSGVMETFEILVGVGDNREEEVAVLNETAVIQADGRTGGRRDGSYDDVCSETSVRIAVDIVANIARMKREE